MRYYKGNPFVISHSKAMISQYFFQLIRTIQEKRILEHLRVLSAAKDLQRPLATPSEIKKVEEQPPPSEEKLDRITAIKRTLHAKLTSELDLKKIDTETSGDSKKMALLREKTKIAILKIIEKEKISFTNRDEMNL